MVHDTTALYEYRTIIVLVIIQAPTVAPGYRSGPSPGRCTSGPAALPCLEAPLLQRVSAQTLSCNSRTVRALIITSKS